jgi:type IV secretory pathway VirB9-like protein
LLLNTQEWEVAYGKNGAEGSRRETVAVRPVVAPLTARGLLVLQSGFALHLKLQAQERPGMLSVTWDVPEKPQRPEMEQSPDQKPPLFDNAKAYPGYTIALDKKAKQPPAWLPDAALDDGKNTLIRFRGSLDGLRVPVVQGLQQNGKPALVQSRLYVRPEHGAWLYVQGVWSGLTLQDPAGIRVTVSRQTPQEGATHAPTY